MNHKLKNERIRRRLVSMLSCIVVFCTTYALILPAVTLERDDIVYYCGKEEHQHTDECYESSKDRPLCGLKDGEMVDGHVHDESCYKTEMVLDCLEDHEHTDECYKEEKTLVCDKEEGAQEHKHSSKCFLSTEPLCGKEVHTHSRECESNKSLKETKEDWEHSIPAKLKDTAAERMVQIALSQKDYKEVKENFELNEEGHEQYYTRYGEWYGRPYEDWNVMFVSFVLRYAEIKNEQIPYGHDWNEWIEDLTKKQLFADEGYLPKDGDLIFIKDKEDENVPDKEIRNYAGIVTDIENRKIVVGDLNGQVKEITLDDKEYETNAYVAMIESDAKDDVPADKEENDDNETNEEERPDEETGKEEANEEETDPIEFRMPEQFEIENEDFTLTLTPRVFDEDVQEDNEEQTEENSEETNEEGLKIKKFSLNEENIQDKIDAENELTKEELEQITQANEEQKKEDEDKPLLTVQLEKIDEQAQTSEEEQAEIEQLKQQSLENVDQDNLLDLSFYKLRFFADGQEVDLKDQKFDAELTPTQKFVDECDVKEEFPDAAPEAEVGVELKFVPLHKVKVEATGTKERTNIFSVNEKEERLLLNSAKAKSLIMSIQSDDLFGFSLEKTDNPSFDVEIYGRLVKNKEATYEDFQQERTVRQSNTFQVIDMTTIPNSFTSNELDFKDYKKKNNQIETYIGEPEQIYSSSTYEYHKAPSLKYFNKLEGINSYTLKEIWLKKPTAANEWFKFIYNNENDSKNIHFTNYENHINLFDTSSASHTTAISGEGKYILITNETVIRLVFDETEASVSENTSFWDYDFFEIKNGDYYIRNNGEIIGINNESNYSGSSNSKLVFGNGSIANHFYPNDLTQNVNKNSRPINQSAGINADKTTNITTYEDVLDNQGNKHHIQVDRLVKSNPIFGLVNSQLNAEGYLTYNVNSPQLFRDGTNVKGKSNELSGNLLFNRSGDTYRLYGVKGPNATNPITGLNSFTTASTYGNKTKYHYNNFWPLDEYDLSKNYGSGGDPGRKDFKDTKTNTSVKSEVSDNGSDHNTAFGMRYEVQFKLDENYTGPLRYFFFGDDDMWVYLDGELICDLGGVHQTIGAEVNIRDVLNRRGKQSGETVHTLVVYFLERGQSGSTCYIEYTLPNVVSMIPENTTGEIKLEKQSNDKSPNKEYQFAVKLTKADGTPLDDEYSLSVFNKNNNSEDTLHSNVTINSSGNFLLANNQYVKIEHLPPGTKYTFTELLSEEDLNSTIVSSCTALGTNNCDITDSGVKPPISINGQLPESFPSAEDIKNNPSLKNQMSHYIKVYNNKTYQLPETGSLGIDPPLIAGSAGVMTTSFYALTLKRKGRWRKRKR